MNTEKTLKHVGIIMDGNRRWAKVKGLPTTFGHSVGVETIDKIIKYSQSLGIKSLTLYAFSTENWNRSPQEVNFLMKIFKNKIKKMIEDFSKMNVKIKFIGNFEKVSGEILFLMKELEKKSVKNTGMNLNIALSYSSKIEIIDAIKLIYKDIIDNNLKIDELNENVFQNYLYTKDQENVDLIIRTGGEFRLSNFLLWQSAYAEIYVTNTLWPDFKETDFDEALFEFSNRKRRFGN